MTIITPLSETYKELGITFTFPIAITNETGKATYHEDSDGFWYRREYDKGGKQTYYEDSDGDWERYEYGEKGNRTYYENSNGIKKGTKRGSCAGKIIEVDGKKYKLMEL